MFETQPLSIEPIAAHIKNTVVARAEVFLRRRRRQLDQLVFREVLPQFGVKLVTNIRRRVGYRIGHEGRFDGFPPAEVALLRMADAVSDTPSKVSDELYAELRQHFTEDELIELAAAAAQENFRARYNRVFDVGSDGLYRKGLRFKQRQVA